ncbi:hypothetical protein QR680_011857 [Steinernema hermaphroditum]|uniref:Alpha-2-macroglobulin domain-containing protein n=1 Tax=Steinernema hermaphroditum TaxID=289476 RepID=A0AA39LZG6_9BILA|nr:hypothetical protein QR680_011857 [Steinernema hermaphroditum]
MSCFDILLPVVKACILLLNVFSLFIYMRRPPQTSRFTTLAVVFVTHIVCSAASLLCYVAAILDEHYYRFFYNEEVAIVVNTNHIVLFQAVIHTLFSTIPNAVLYAFMFVKVDEAIPGSAVDIVLLSSYLSISIISVFTLYKLMAKKLFFSTLRRMLFQLIHWFVLFLHLHPAYPFPAVIVAPNFLRWGSKNDIWSIFLGDENDKVPPELHFKVATESSEFSIIDKRIANVTPGKILNFSVDLTSSEIPRLSFDAVANDVWGTYTHRTGIPNLKTINLRTDKLFYRGGEIVRLKALPITVDGNIYLGKISYHLKNPYNFELLTKKVSAKNRFIDLKFQLPHVLQHGEWTIYAKPHLSEDHSAVVRRVINEMLVFKAVFEVRDYEPPQMHVLLDVSFPTVIEHPLVTVAARFAHGAKVNGTVRFECQRNDDEQILPLNTLSIRNGFLSAILHLDACLMSKDLAYVIIFATVRDSSSSVISAEVFKVDLETAGFELVPLKPAISSKTKSILLYVRLDNKNLYNSKDNVSVSVTCLSVESDETLNRALYNTTIGEIVEIVGKWNDFRSCYCLEVTAWRQVTASTTSSRLSIFIPNLWQSRVTDFDLIDYGKTGKVEYYVGETFMVTVAERASSFMVICDTSTIVLFGEITDRKVEFEVSRRMIPHCVLYVYYFKKPNPITDMFVFFVENICPYRINVNKQHIRPSEDIRIDVMGEKGGLALLHVLDARMFDLIKRRVSKPIAFLWSLSLFGKDTEGQVSLEHFTDPYEFEDVVPGVPAAAPLQPVEVHIRQRFPEVWFFEDIPLDSSGHGQLTLHSADSIANWSIAASFWGNGHFDVCGITPTYVVSKQEFFMTVDLPKHVYANETVAAEIVVTKDGALQEDFVDLSVCIKGVDYRACVDQGASGDLGEELYNRVHLEKGTPSALKKIPIYFGSSGDAELLFTLRRQSNVMVYQCEEGEILDQVKLTIVVERPLDTELFHKNFLISSQKPTEKRLKRAFPEAIECSLQQLTNSTVTDVNLSARDAEIIDLSLSISRTPITPSEAFPLSSKKRLFLGDVLKELSVKLFMLKSLNRDPDNNPLDLGVNEFLENEVKDLFSEMLSFSNCASSSSYCGFATLKAPTEVKDMSLSLTAIAILLRCQHREAADAQDAQGPLNFLLSAVQTLESQEVDALVNEHTDARDTFLLLLIRQVVEDCHYNVDHDTSSWHDWNAKMHNLLMSKIVDIAKTDDPMMMASIAYMGTNALKEQMTEKLRATISEGTVPFWSMGQRPSETFNNSDFYSLKPRDILLNSLGILAFLGPSEPAHLEDLVDWLYEQQGSDGGYVSVLDTYFASKAVYEYRKKHGQNKNNAKEILEVNYILSEKAVKTKLTLGDYPLLVQIDASATNITVVTPKEAKIDLSVKLVISKRQHVKRHGEGENYPVLSDLVGKTETTTYGIHFILSNVMSNTAKHRGYPKDLQLGPLKQVCYSIQSKGEVYEPSSLAPVMVSARTPTGGVVGQLFLIHPDAELSQVRKKRSTLAELSVVDNICFDGGVCACAEASCRVKCAQCDKLTSSSLRKTLSVKETIACVVRITADPLPLNSTGNFIQLTVSSLTSSEVIMLWLRQCNYNCYEEDIERFFKKGETFVFIGHKLGSVVDSQQRRHYVLTNADRFEKAEKNCNLALAEVVNLANIVCWSIVILSLLPLEEISFVFMTLFLTEFFVSITCAVFALDRVLVLAVPIKYTHWKLSSKLAVFVLLTQIVTAVGYYAVNAVGSDLMDDMFLFAFPGALFFETAMYILFVVFMRRKKKNVSTKTTLENKRANHLVIFHAVIHTLLSTIPNTAAIFVGNLVDDDSTVGALSVFAPYICSYVSVLIISIFTLYKLLPKGATQKVVHIAAFQAK